MTDLSYFQENVDDEVVTRQRPLCYKNVQDIEAMIAAHRPKKAVELHANLVAENEQWLWFDLYNLYEAEYAAVEEYNTNLKASENVAEDAPNSEDTAFSGADNLPVAEPKEYPSEPVRPALRTGKDILESLNYYVATFKAERAIAVEAIKVTVDDMVFDGDETSQTRMSRAILGMRESGIPSILWKLADNTVASVTIKQMGTAMLLAGQKQSDLWGMDDE